MCTKVSFHQEELRNSRSALAIPAAIEPAWIFAYMVHAPYREIHAQGLARSHYERHVGFQSSGNFWRKAVMSVIKLDGGCDGLCTGGRTIFPTLDRPHPSSRCRTRHKTFETRNTIFLRLDRANSATAETISTDGKGTHWYSPSLPSLAKLVICRLRVLGHHATSSSQPFS